MMQQQLPAWAPLRDVAAVGGAVAALSQLPAVQAALPSMRCLLGKGSSSSSALCGLLLYAQARSRGKPWSMEAKYETGDIVCLQVEYDAHRAWGGLIQRPR